MHRWSKLFVPTLREAPADAEVASHKFLLRAGYIRQLGAGIYNYLPLGQRALNKIIAIVREEMDTIGQEFLLPAIHPREVWEASGRWAVMGDNMFRLKRPQRRGTLLWGMTHEEIVTGMARKMSCAATSSCRRSGTRFRTSFATSRGPRADCCAYASSP